MDCGPLCCRRASVFNVSRVQLLAISPRLEISGSICASREAECAEPHPPLIGTLSLR